MDFLTLNCGSSSVKYQLYRWEAKEVIARGAVERIGIEGSQIQHYSRRKGDICRQQACADHREAILLLTQLLLDPEVGVIRDVKDIAAVGHRIVHGGERFSRSVLIDQTALATFRELANLAPLHNPPNIVGVEAAQEILPAIPHCAIMDTAWHQTMPAHAYVYGLPYTWYESHAVRRYGFHGTSFLYVAKRAAVLLGTNPFDSNLILLHIGNGASANAVRNGLSVDTSMGFTPLEGLLMGTRAGDHDPTIGLHMMQKAGLESGAVQAILNRGSGILGITGNYVDRRDVIQAAERGEQRARLALDIEAYRIKKYIGAYYAALGRVDAIVFTAGVGEMSPIVRQKSLEGLENLGIRLSPEKNRLSVTRNAETEIGASESAVRIFVIPTDEELVMTEDSRALLEGRYDVHTRFHYMFQSAQYRNKQRREAFAAELSERPGLAHVVAQVSA